MHNNNNKTESLLLLRLKNLVSPTMRGSDHDASKLRKIETRSLEFDEGFYVIHQLIVSAFRLVFVCPEPNLQTSKCDRFLEPSRTDRQTHKYISFINMDIYEMSLLQFFVNTKICQISVAVQKGHSSKFFNCSV